MTLRSVNMKLVNLIFFRVISLWYLLTLCMLGNSVLDSVPGSLSLYLRVSKIKLLKINVGVSLSALLKFTGYCFVSLCILWIVLEYILES